MSLEAEDGRRSILRASSGAQESATPRRWCATQLRTTACLAGTLRTSGARLATVDHERKCGVDREAGAEEPGQLLLGDGVVNPLRPVPEEHPHGLSDAAFEALFTTDRPVGFAFHGYPWSVHRLT